MIALHPNRAAATPLPLQSPPFCFLQSHYPQERALRLKIPTLIAGVVTGIQIIALNPNRAAATAIPCLIPPFSLLTITLPPKIQRTYSGIRLPTLIAGVVTGIQMIALHPSWAAARATLSSSFPFSLLTITLPPNIEKTNLRSEVPTLIAGVVTVIQTTTLRPI